MRLIVAAVGQKMPRWISEGCSEYQRRMPAHLNLSITEVPLGKRGRNPDLRRAIAEEAAALLSALPNKRHLVALDAGGSQWTTEDLAQRLGEWQHGGKDVGFVIGGPDGLDESLLGEADQIWSLGPLTLPHPLVRVLIIEQLYRAWTITQGHPYHRQ